MSKRARTNLRLLHILLHFLEVTFKPRDHLLHFTRRKARIRDLSRVGEERIPSERKPRLFCEVASKDVWRRIGEVPCIKGARRDGIVVVE